MPAPSQLSISTSSLIRLLKDENSYHKELDLQEARIRRLEDGGGDSDENAEFRLQQERKVLEETKAVFDPLRQRIRDATTELEQQLAATEQPEDSVEVTEAKAALEAAKTA